MVRKFEVKVRWPEETIVLGESLKLALEEIDQYPPEDLLNVNALEPGVFRLRWMRETRHQVYADTPAEAEARCLEWFQPSQSDVQILGIREVGLALEVRFRVSVEVPSKERDRIVQELLNNGDQILKVSRSSDASTLLIVQTATFKFPYLDQPTAEAEALQRLSVLHPDVKHAAVVGFEEVPF